MAQVSTNRRMNKQWLLCTMKCCSAIKIIIYTHHGLYPSIFVHLNAISIIKLNFSNCLVYLNKDKRTQKRLECQLWQYLFCKEDHFSSLHSFSHIQLFATLWTAAHQAFLSITNSWSLLKLMSNESVMPSNHLILCCPLLLMPSIFPSIRVFSNESVLCIRWPKYWSFSFSISPSNEYSGLTECGPLEKGMANHFSILSLRTP